MSVQNSPFTDEMTPESIINSASRTLDITHRCDTCGAQAYVKAVMKSNGLPLLFCAHHGHKSESALRPLTVDWIDESRFINEKPSSSANA